MDIASLDTLHSMAKELKKALPQSEEGLQVFSTLHLELDRLIKLIDINMSIRKGKPVLLCSEKMVSVKGKGKKFLLKILSEYDSKIKQL